MNNPYDTSLYSLPPGERASFDAHNTPPSQAFFDGNTLITPNGEAFEYEEPDKKMFSLSFLLFVSINLMFLAGLYWT